MITVSELIEELSELDPDTVVVLSKDGEGNSFSPYSDYNDGQYFPDTTWAGEFHSQQALDSPEEYFEDEEIPEDGLKAICLWPTN